MSSTREHVPDSRGAGPAQGEPAFDCDVAIVGGGMAGTAAAIALGRRGIASTLIDLHATFPDDFRAEKMTGEQADQLRDLGLLEAIAAKATCARRVRAVRFGRLVHEKSLECYGIPYQDIVNTLRAELPPGAELVAGRVVELETGSERQVVRLGDGRTVSARLVVLATGLGDALKRKLGIRRRVVRADHLTTIGFDVLPAGRAGFPFEALTYFGERPEAAVAYLTLLPIGSALRANLFTYRGHRDPMVQAFRSDPGAALAALLPGFGRHLGPALITGEVQIRPTDLTVVDEPVRDGVVLVGDAFQTSCPAVGDGTSKVMTDVDQLCNVHIPAWLASPGMGRDKIAGYYADPHKLARDRDARLRPERLRSATIGEGVGERLARRVVEAKWRLADLRHRWLVPDSAGLAGTAPAKG